jgi:hypothetical protein
MEVIFTSPIFDSVSIVLINMLSDIPGILPISVSKAAILALSTSVAESYIVIRYWSRSAFISTDRSLVISNSSNSRIRANAASPMFCLDMLKLLPFLLLTHRFVVSQVIKTNVPSIIYSAL